MPSIKIAPPPPKHVFLDGATSLALKQHSNDLAAAAITLRSVFGHGAAPTSASIETAREALGRAEASVALLRTFFA